MRQSKTIEFFQCGEGHHHATDVAANYCDLRRTAISLRRNREERWIHSGERRKKWEADNPPPESVALVLKEFDRLHGVVIQMYGSQGMMSDLCCKRAAEIYGHPHDLLFAVLNYGVSFIRGRARNNTLSRQLDLWLEEIKRHQLEYLPSDLLLAVPWRR